MTETLTIRLPAAQRRALRARAAASGKTESELVRELIDAQTRSRGTVAERAGRHFGRLDFDPTAAARGDAWRAHMLKANVRP